MKRCSPKRVMAMSPFQAANESIGLLTPGCGILGITKGQFSLLDLIRAISQQVGPAALTVSTWSTGIRDTINIGTLIDRGDFTSVTLLLDRSFAGRQPKYVEEVIRAWGRENVRMTRNHAKFFLLRNAEWNICCRSSMNLNRNPRLEQFDIDDSLEMCEFFAKVISEIFQKMPSGLIRESKKCDEVFPSLLGGGISYQYNPDDLNSLGCDIGEWEKWIDDNDIIGGMDL